MRSASRSGHGELDWYSHCLGPLGITNLVIISESYHAVFSSGIKRQYSSCRFLSKSETASLGHRAVPRNSSRHDM